MTNASSKYGINKKKKTPGNTWKGMLQTIKLSFKILRYMYVISDGGKRREFNA